MLEAVRGGCRGVRTPPARVSVRVRVHGFLYETTTQLRFEGAKEEEQEAEFVVSLSEGATMCDFAMDVDGTMCDGVVVPKEKARVAFESERRAGKTEVAVGEIAGGNQFRTRVVLPKAPGYREIRIGVFGALASDNAGMAYRYDTGLPQYPCQAFELTVLVESTEDGVGPPQFEGEQFLGQYFFLDEGTGLYTLNFRTSDAAPPATLSFHVPNISRAIALVGRSLSNPQESFFAVRHLLEAPSAASAAEDLPHQAKLVGILWDTSYSRGSRNKNREMQALRDIYAAFPDCCFDLFYFSMELSQPIRFADLESLEAHLLHCEYDGATNFECLNALNHVPVSYARHFLFSDGVSTVGGEFTCTTAPVFAITSSTVTDFHLLKKIVNSSGGEFFNLSQIPPETVGNAARTHSKALLLLGARFNPGAIVNMLPPLPAVLPPAGAATRVSFVCGTIPAHLHNVPLTLQYGSGGSVHFEQTYILSPPQQHNEIRDSLVSRFWATCEVDEVLSGYEASREEKLKKVGKTFRIATPVTSFVVLTTAEQYLKYDVDPPACISAEVRRVFELRREEQREEEGRKQERRTATLDCVWARRMLWFKTESGKAVPHEAQPHFVCHFLDVTRDAEADTIPFEMPQVFWDVVTGEQRSSELSLAEVERWLPEICSSTEEESNAVVVALGPYDTKAGFAGDERPQAHFKTVFARLPSLQVGACTVGEDAVWPLNESEVTDWVALEAILRHALYGTLHADAQRPLLLSFPALASEETLHRAEQMLFNRFHAEAVKVVNDAELGMYASGRTTGVVVDIGHTSTSVVVICDGSTLPGTLLSVPHGGKSVTENLIQLLFQRGYSISFEEANVIKEKLCFAREAPRAVGATSASLILADGSVHCLPVQRQTQKGHCAE
eukprot:TRINITY_DN1409_c0_g2_i2.p1 TRINITY_DN1409_c0_g2~~TRINITY_DN1409_c0_g2_i2.p1  ORF type:complete len:910 (-),score=148.51 TRINITY_DN1409_c0_g2_i2:6-2696(-)